VFVRWLPTLLLLLGCTGAPSAPPSQPVVTPVDDVADDAIADAGAASGSPAVEGVLSEAAFKALHELSGDAAPPAKGTEITLPSGSKAYLSLPEGAKAPMPAVLVIHEWWGLNDNIRHWADRLAADGYAALAVDLYGTTASTPDEAMALMKAVDEAKATATLREAHAFLATDERVVASKIGSVGWCFGGGWSLRLALAEPELDAAVIYYGRLIEDPAQLATLNAPLLGHFGVQDEGIPVDAVQRFHDAVKAAGKPITVNMYDANHAFANPSSARYQEQAAGMAWDRTRAFFAHHLKGQP
jgi:carboxymethylenebutenolidase